MSFWSYHVHPCAGQFLFASTWIFNKYLPTFSIISHINQPNVGNTIHRSYGIFWRALLFSAAGMFQHRLHENKWNPRCRELLHGMGDGCRFQPLIFRGVSQLSGTAKHINFRYFHYNTQRKFWCSDFINWNLPLFWLCLAALHHPSLKLTARKAPEKMQKLPKKNRSLLSLYHSFFRCKLVVTFREGTLEDHPMTDVFG